MRATLVYVLLTACSGVAAGHSPSPARIESTAPPPGSLSELDQATALERGVRGHRDFAAAATIYDRLCADGAGDPLACRRLVDAIRVARGTAFDQGRLVRVESAMCQNGAPAACISAQISMEEGPDRQPLEAQLDRLAGPDGFDRRCDKGDVAACEVVWLVQGLGLRSGSTRIGSTRIAAKLCGLDDLDACFDLVSELSACASASRRTACVDVTVADWTERGAVVQLAALARLRGRCDLGEVDACHALPGREISSADLCAAHDYGACAERACLGDLDARRQADANGGMANCKLVKSRETSARHADTPLMPACARYLQIQERYMACAKAPAEKIDRMKQALWDTRREFATAWDVYEGYDAEVGAHCAASSTALATEAAALGCSLD
ncbi:MAG: hypothetical protein K8W52_24605 [Deltaproteobacteria bacterium]|nr:hypothetical protein [Deltaproteobacteria bacterium]